MKTTAQVGTTLVLLITTVCFSATVSSQGIPQSMALFQENCAVCHGENLEGAALGPPLIGELRHGDAMTDIVTSIRGGYEAAGMPAWSRTLSDAQIRNLGLFITETRNNVTYATFNYDTPLEIPADLISTELHDFRIETVAEGLDAQPFSIEPLPDGRILLTEKMYGVSIIGLDGQQSALIEGTPQVYDDTFIQAANQEWGWGWLFDIKLHPDYQENGWIYLYYGDRCEGCNAISRAADNAPVSMNKLIRGRIEEGRWVDQEVIWEADIEHYNTMVDVAAGGRIAFDNLGHLYLSVGMKGPDNHHGIQDLSTPWGKVHRIYDDGSIPDDNPFANRDNVYRSIYTYGHRSPQGLEFDLKNGELWGTEHGPRGGDEVNHLQAGRNYGWPLYSRGMDYDGTPVEYGRDLGIVFELSDIVQPVVDLTPSPAVSSFIIADTDQFPGWRDDFLVGSLKARSLFRFRMENNQLVHRETLLEGIARIRDIEQGFNGDIYLLLEHNNGSQIVRLVPAG
jgi:glucose/arabinose dehydrogenase